MSTRNGKGTVLADTIYLSSSGGTVYGYKPATDFLYEIFDTNLPLTDLAFGTNGVLYGLTANGVYGISRAGTSSSLAFTVLGSPVGLDIGYNQTLGKMEFLISYADRPEVEAFTLDGDARTVGFLPEPTFAGRPAPGAPYSGDIAIIGSGAFWVSAFDRIYEFTGSLRPSPTLAAVSNNHFTGITGGYTFSEVAIYRLEGIGSIFGTRNEPKYVGRTDDRGDVADGTRNPNAVEIDGVITGADTVSPLAPTTGSPNLRGTIFDDVLNGDGRANLIEGLGGDDAILAGAGSDTVRGGTGDDDIQGEYGNDRLDGGGGADYVDGGAGNDRVFGRAGDDIVAGGDGNDLLDGGNGNDQLLAGDGDDTIMGNTGFDTVDGGDGTDRLTYANALSPARSVGAYTVRVSDVEILFGSRFSDVLRVDWDGMSDALRYVDMGAGNDFGSIWLADGGRWLGGTGNDVMSVRSFGPAALDGGAGFDVVRYDEGFQGVAVDMANLGRLGANDRYFSVERVVGTEFSDILLGNAAANQFFGLGGNDRFYGSFGADLFVGGAGYDTVHYTFDRDGVTASLSNPAVNKGMAAGDRFVGIERLVGGSGNDTLIGTARKDALLAGSGNDRLFGGGGDDALQGGAGSDIIFGQSGDDRIVGGAGPDNLVGGPGDDVFIVTPDAAFEVIHDFTSGEDMIDATLTGVDFDAMTIGRAANGTDVRFEAGEGTVLLRLLGVDPAALTADDFVVG